MRLLNTKLLHLKFFQDGQTPLYAALSHVHGYEEIVYKDFEAMDAQFVKEPELRHQTLSKKGGYKKLRRCCELALSSGIEWIWIATCCVDWSSRIEMNGAVNLAYERMNRARVCYVYLHEIETDGHGEILWGQQYPLHEVFSRCSWFSRLWTLQELLAPPFMDFFNANWVKLGTKASLATEISYVTSISPRYLTGEIDPVTAPYAERVSWATSRRSLVVEDNVYAILGLFQINMEIDYGEGAKAFSRFRLQILENCDGTALIGRQALTASKKKLIGQLDHTGISIEPFENFFRHSILSVSQNPNQSWDDIRNFAVQIAESPPRLTDSGFKITTLCRKVYDFLVVWTFNTQEVAGSSFAICTKVTVLADFSTTSQVSVRGRLEDQVYHVRRKRLCGFELCDIYFPVETTSATLQLFVTGQLPTYDGSSDDHMQ